MVRGYLKNISASVRTLGIAALAATALSVTSAKAEARKPNVVLILMDNFGYGELGTYGGGTLRGAPTPQIDSLARDGMKLTNFNGEAWCSPSRSALLTGRFAIRSGTNESGGRGGGLVRWEITMAEALHDAGYVSALFGKWHLGSQSGRFPTDQGFDEWYGIPRSNDESMWTSAEGYDPAVVPPTYTLEGRRGGESHPVALFDLDMRSRFDSEITRRGIDFIKRTSASGKPFFLYLPMTTGHFPTVPSPDWKGRTGNGPWADVLASLDHNVGELMGAVDAAGIREDTIFIFTADNGADYLPWNRGSPGPWGGGYISTMEGGIRIPFLIRWPGKIPAGRESNDIMHLVDIFPTLADAAGIGLPKDRAIDGVDQLAFLTGRQQNSNRDFFPIYMGDQLMAVKWKNWKLVFGPQGAKNGQAVGRLYNLITDQREEQDIYSQNTWISPILESRMKEFSTSLTKYPPIKPGTPDPYNPRR